MRRLPLCLAIVPVVAVFGVGRAAGQEELVPLEVRVVEPAVQADAVALDAPPRRPRGRARAQGDPFEYLSSQSLLDTLEELTAIGAHQGWRQSTTEGESLAMALVEARLGRLHRLGSIGLQTWRRQFRTFTGVEFWETSVTLERNGEAFVAPADGAPGHRDWLHLALRIDSDGQLNDRDRNPVVVSGDPLVVRTANQIYGLSPDQVAGRVVLLDYAVIDRMLMSLDEAVARAWVLIEKGPAAVVMITQNSNEVGESHGTFATDFPPFTWVEVAYDVPVLSAMMEDLEPFGVADWADLEALDRVGVTWDVDLFAPGDSEYLVARIPGLDSTRAVILGAHIDSSNTPGAFDDGSGATALLEVARVMDRGWVVPEVDLILVWFGSHERGLYGSYNFTAQNSELLDRTLAMLQMDCLGHPLDGVTNEIWLESWSYAAHGDASIPWPAYLQDLTRDLGVATRIADVHALVSDNSSFSGYGVPNANLIFMNPFEPIEVHYGNRLHDPYDGMELARLEGDAFEDMATVMLAAALRTAVDDPDLRVPPAADRRAVFVGSHTEGIHMSPAGMTEFGMTLAWEGFDVDMIPYGEPVTAESLENADLVVLLPVHDYPTQGGDLSLYDERWRASEIDVIEQYVAGGGVLVLTATAHRLKYLNYAFDVNEDRLDVNPVAGRFGVTFQLPVLPGSRAYPTGDHPLVSGVSLIRMAADNGLALTAPEAEPLAAVGGALAAVVVEHGAGTVVALGDLGMLGANQDPPANLRFWRNLARFAR